VYILSHLAAENMYGPGCSRSTFVNRKDIPHLLT
jgi:hypothetical protein